MGSLLSLACHTLPSAETGFVIEHLGKAIVEAYGRDPTGELASAIATQFPGSRIMGRLQEILRNPSDLSEEGEFAGPAGDTVKFRSCLLPFGEGQNVTHVIAGISWKTLPPPSL